MKITLYKAIVLRVNILLQLDTNQRLYRDAGGVALRDDEFRSIVKKMIPDVIRDQIILSTHQFNSFMDMKEYIREKARAMTVARSAKSTAVHMVEDEFGEDILEMGFEEMKTNMFVESSFWNFDALFQPQQHPARDAHDTFFIKAPAATRSLPADYMARVKATHEDGGEGLGPEFAAKSAGWKYDWAEEEARMIRASDTSDHSPDAATLVVPCLTYARASRVRRRAQRARSNANCDRPPEPNMTLSVSEHRVTPRGPADQPPLTERPGSRLQIVHVVPCWRLSESLAPASPLSLSP